MARDKTLVQIRYADEFKQNAEALPAEPYHFYFRSETTEIRQIRGFRRRF
jgi:hypothetical protein